MNPGMSVFRSFAHGRVVIGRGTHAGPSLFQCRHSSNGPFQVDSDLLARLKNDLKSSMRAKTPTRTQVIKSLLSEITYSQKSAGPTSTLSTLIQRSIQKRTDAASAYTQAGRTDLAASELDEAKVLGEYLPEQLTEAQIEELVKGVVSEVGASGVKDLGKVMKTLGERVDDGAVAKKVLSGIVKRVLEGLPK
ncbi:Yqey-like protein-domain-containing protein [Phlyctochytrium arcticum]|nr:Yqey-like protein-domain-containing protein [Phlyctochytrium arcticum]